MDPRIARLAGVLRDTLARYPGHHARAAVESTLEALEGHGLGDAERACAELALADGCFACATRFAAGQRDRCDDCRVAAERECPACGGEGCDGRVLCLRCRGDGVIEATREEQGAAR